MHAFDNVNTAPLAYALNQTLFYSAISPYLNFFYKWISLSEYKILTFIEYLFDNLMIECDGIYAWPKTTRG